LGPLDPLYDEARATPDRATIAARPRSLWRYREWLPFTGEPVLSLDTGWTPLLEAPALARRLGVARAWVKNDAVSHPSLSFKDRVVATAINAAHAFGLDTIGCASTGNLANAVAAHAARAGLRAWIFVPEDLETGKIVGTAVYGPRLVRLRGTYDDVNRVCAQLADRFGWGIVNVNLRGYYGEGSKTVAFEIVEQLGWRFPSAVVAPMAGGSLLTKLRKGFAEFLGAGLATGAAPRLYGAQAEGCAPIVRLVERGGTDLVPEVPHTIARSIAIGNPADGRYAARAIHESGGWAAAVTDAELVAAIRVLAETTGVFTETAGGVTVAAALALARARRLRPDDEVVLCITGNGLKTVEALEGALDAAPVVAPRLRDVTALVTHSPATTLSTREV
ncbi:MAG: threonine synthase, partial [Gemmatimonadales bacterium]